MKPVEFKIVNSPRFDALELADVVPPVKPALKLTLKEIAYKGINVIIEPRDYYFEATDSAARCPLQIPFKINSSVFTYDAEFNLTTGTVAQRITGEPSEVAQVAIFFDVDQQVKFVAK